MAAPIFIKARLIVFDQGCSTRGVTQVIQKPDISNLAPAFAEGEITVTAIGRLTTPFPRIDLTTSRRAYNSSLRAREWLACNAMLEAQARQNSLKHRLFASIKVKNASPADLDSAVLYLFDDDLATSERQRPAFLKSLIEESPWVDPTVRQPIWLLSWQSPGEEKVQGMAFGNKKAAESHAVNCGLNRYRIERLTRLEVRKLS